MDKVALKTAPRAQGTSVKDLRRQGQVPGIIYGNVAENMQVQMEEVALKKAYQKAGESTLVELETEKGKVPVLFHAIDQDPVSDRMIHVDFFAVNMKEEVETEVHIRFEGEAPAVKDLSAILVTALHEVTVRCLPADLPHDLAVDLSKLTEFGSTITVTDIAVPEGVTILNDPGDVIAVAQEPREEEVEEAPVVAEGAEGAVAEGAAPAEGEAAAGEGEKKGE